jgi:hypothetical protein
VNRKAKRQSLAFIGVVEPFEFGLRYTCKRWLLPAHTRFDWKASLSFVIKIFSKARPRYYYLMRAVVLLCFVAVFCVQ